jgi:subtilisin family serine protease
MRALVLSFFLAFCASAPLYKHEETIDKGNLRSYLIIFNEQAPHLTALDKLLEWVRVEAPFIQPELIENGVWYNTVRGFQAYLSVEGLEALLDHRHIAYIEADTIYRTQQSWTSRLDWGQNRANQRNRNLATINPAGLYDTASSSIDGLGQVSTWSWGTTPATNTYTGANSVVYIMDTGVNPTHQEYVGRIVVSRSFLTGNTSADDGNGHGTHCAGSAVGRYRGVATAASLGNLRVLNNQGSGSTSNIVSACDWLVQNQYNSDWTQVLSMSLGGSFSQAMNDAMVRVANAGIIPVVAAGNDAGDACNYSPASSDIAVTVGAINNVDSIASFSNFGPCVDVFAPGYYIHSSWIGSSSAYDTISGTSMATPLVAGALAAYSTAAGKLRVGNANTALSTYSTKNAITFPGNKSSQNWLIYSRWDR